MASSSGLNGLLGAGDDQEREVFGDRSSLIRFSSIVSQPTEDSRDSPDADPRPGGIEVGDDRLAVAGGEGDLRFPAVAQPDQRRGDGVFALEDRLEAIERVGTRSAATGSNISLTGHDRRTRRRSPRRTRSGRPPLQDGQVGGSLGKVFGACQLGVGIEAFELDHGRVRRAVQLQELDHPFELPRRPRYPGRKPCGRSAEFFRLSTWLSVSEESEKVCSRVRSKPRAAVAECDHVDDDQDSRRARPR